MFWVILLSHFIADYPLQTDAMVVAKKRGVSGLLMHVAMHFLSMVVVLCAIFDVDASDGVGLAFVVSGFHYAIEHWKNVLSRLRPKWVIFGYIQDQLLHYTSILLVVYLSLRFGWSSFQVVDHPEIIYAIGFILVTHFWFVTVRVLSNKNSSYNQWVGETMWPRMMSRAILYCAVVVGFNVWLLAIIAAAVIVGWNDLSTAVRRRTLVVDCAGVTVLIITTLWIVN